MKLGYFRQIFEKFSSFKFHENSSSGVWLFHADGRTDGQTVRAESDTRKVIVAIRKFAT